MMFKKLFVHQEEQPPIDFHIPTIKPPTPRAYFGQAVIAVNKRIEELTKDASLEERSKITHLLERIDNLSTNAYTTYHLSSGESFII